MRRHCTFYAGIHIPYIHTKLIAPPRYIIELRCVQFRSLVFLFLYLYYFFHSVMMLLLLLLLLVCQFTLTQKLKRKITANFTLPINAIPCEIRLFIVVLLLSSSSSTSSAMALRNESLLTNADADY